jgi:hypothetical protein
MKQMARAKDGGGTRCPVLCVQDGQNLFELATAFIQSRRIRRRRAISPRWTFPERRRAFSVCIVEQSGDNQHRNVERTRVLRQLRVNRGRKTDSNLAYHEIPGERHSEHAWAARFGFVLTWMFSRRS